MAAMKPAQTPRPILEIPRSGMEKVLEYASFFGLLAMFALVAAYWVQLPARVPMHFNAAGKVDGWGPKASVWAVPVVTSALYLLLTLVSRIPHAFNYPWPITENNAARQYQLARLFVVSLKLDLVLVFFSITFVICQMGRGQGGLGFWFLPLGVGALFVVIGAYIVAAYRAR
jgi:uncharacterized membrane protein